MKEQIIEILDELTTEVVRAITKEHYDPDSISGKAADKIIALLEGCYEECEESEADLYVSEYMAGSKVQWLRKINN